MIRVAAVLAVAIAIGFLLAGYRDYRNLIRRRDQLDQEHEWTEDQL